MSPPLKINTEHLFQINSNSINSELVWKPGVINRGQRVFLYLLLFEQEMHLLGQRGEMIEQLDAPPLLPSP